MSKRTKKIRQTIENYKKVLNNNKRILTIQMMEFAKSGWGTFPKVVRLT